MWRAVSPPPPPSLPLIVLVLFNCLMITLGGPTHTVPTLPNTDALSLHLSHLSLSAQHMDGSMLLTSTWMAACYQQRLRYECSLPFYSIFLTFVCCLEWRNVIETLGWESQHSNKLGNQNNQNNAFVSITK